MANAKVMLRIRQLQDDAAHRNDLSVDWVLQHLKEIVERAMGEPFQGKVAVNALEAIGKHLGMFTGKGENPVNVNMTMAQLVQAVAERRSGGQPDTG